MRHFYIFLFLFSSTLVLFAQEEQNNNSTNLLSEDFYRSAIGISVTHNSYYGDLKPSLADPLDGRIGFLLSLKSYVTPYLFTKFYLENKDVSNARTKAFQDFFFQSNITSLGVIANYNFSHFIKKETHIIEPYIGLGIEIINFNSKADLFNSKGERYHLWDDGLLRNLPENTNNISTAKVITRDYVFETDLREYSLENGYRYDPFAFSVPITIGVSMRLSHRVNFNIGVTYHYLLTDLIDNISNNSTNLPKGNSFSANNDFLLSSSIGLAYKFGLKKEYKIYNKDAISAKGSRKNLTSVDPVISKKDIVFLSNEDLDKDGVPDIIDLCPKTPENIKVDENGCPLDLDKDGIFDYQDDEKTIIAGAKINKRGVTITDNYVEKKYLASIDISGKYAKIERRKIESKKGKTLNSTYYTIGLSSLNGYSVPLILNLRDLKMFGKKSTIKGYHFSNYNTIKNTLKRKIRLEKAGLKNLTIIKHVKDKAYYITDKVNLASISKSKISIERNSLIVRIQIKTSKEPIPIKDFKLEVIEIYEKGVYKYLLAKTFSNFASAAKMKINLTIDGYKKVTIRAFERWKEVNYRATMKKSELKKDKNGAFHKDAIRFIVQIGVFHNQLELSAKKRLEKYGRVYFIKTREGVYKYFIGSFKNIDDATRLHEKLKIDKIDSFVNAKYYDTIISVYKAQEILHNQ